MNSSFTRTRSLQALFLSIAILLSSWWDRSCVDAFSNSGAAFYQKSTLRRSSSRITRPSRISEVMLQQSSSSSTTAAFYSSSWPMPPNPKWQIEKKTTMPSKSIGLSSNENAHGLHAFTSSGKSGSGSRSSSSRSSSSNSNDSTSPQQQRGLEELKQMEANLKRQLDDIQFEKRFVLQSRPLNIGVVGFGRFGRFICSTFTKYGRVVATSRSDYSDIASSMGVKYVRLTNPGEFLSHDLDVIIFATSILSFASTIQSFVPHLEKDLERRRQRQRRGVVNGNDSDDAKIAGPLIVDVLSVKEHPRQVLLQYLPKECDILCSHPMFGPDSGKNGWTNLNFVYEKTRINGEVLLGQDITAAGKVIQSTNADSSDTSSGEEEKTALRVKGMDRMERFLSIWEEEGCNMIDMTCRVHDEYASNSQFITHLMGRILGSQGLSPTPIDTSGFKSVLRLIDSTTADSFDLFYGLYKFNTNSRDTISQLKSALDEVVDDLTYKEKQEQKYYLERKQPDAITSTTLVSSSTEGGGELKEHTPDTKSLP